MGLQRAVLRCPFLPCALTPTCQGHTAQVTADRILPLGISQRPETPADMHSVSAHRTGLQRSRTKHGAAQRSMAQHVAGVTQHGRGLK